MFFEPGKANSKRFKTKLELVAAVRDPIPYEIMSFTELAASVGKEFICDVECYINYFLVAFRSVETKRVCYLEMFEDTNLNTEMLSWIMWSVCSIGFNTKKYDNIMIAAALSGSTCEELKVISDKIIKEGMREDDLAEEFHFKPLRKINFYDLFDVAPLTDSLKKYAARMHAKRLQELPYPEDSFLTEGQINEVRNYCIGADTVNTDLLRAELVEQIALRVNLGRMYGGVDLRSKSDAQIAEAVIMSEIRKLTDRYIKKPEFDINYCFKYQPPAFVCFQTPHLQEIFEKIKELRFNLDGGGSPRCDELTGNKENRIKGIEANINGRTYTLGIGGLHSTEKSQAIVPKAGWHLLDTDFDSFYPKMILNNEWYPAHLGREFLTVFQIIVNRRLNGKAEANKAKKAGNKELEKTWKVEADSLKITINGSFGKLGSMFSMLYSPDLLVQTTVTGQLTLLMLIEACELAGICVISANTDGFVVHLHDSQRDTFNSIIKGFERLSNMKTEETEYKALYSRDVNNYIAIKTDGEVKVKGEYSEKGSTGNTRLSKNPQALIVADALTAFLSEGKSIVETVKACKDLTRFVCVQNVKGGGHQNGLYLGKTVRWVYGKNSHDTINYTGSGNTVANSFGAMPLMDLPNEFPANIDHDRYISYALQALVDIGHTKQQGYLF